MKFTTFDAEGDTVFDRDCKPFGAIESPFNDAFWLRYFAAAAMTRRKVWAPGESSKLCVEEAEDVLMQIKRVEAEEKK